MVQKAGSAQGHHGHRARPPGAGGGDGVWGTRSSSLPRGWPGGTPDPHPVDTSASPLSSETLSARFIRRPKEQAGTRASRLPSGQGEQPLGSGRLRLRSGLFGNSSAALRQRSGLFGSASVLLETLRCSSGLGSKSEEGVRSRLAPLARAARVVCACAPGLSSGQWRRRWSVGPCGATVVSEGPACGRLRLPE